MYIHSIITSFKLVILYVMGFFLSIIAMYLLKSFGQLVLPFIILSILISFFLSGIILYFHLENKIQVIVITFSNFILLFLFLFAVSSIVRSTLINSTNATNMDTLDGRLTLIVYFFTNIVVQTAYTLSIFILGYILLVIKNKHREFSPTAVNPDYWQTPQNSFFHNFPLTILHYMHYTALFIFLYTLFKINENIMTKQPFESATSYIDYIQTLIAMVIITPIFLISLVVNRKLLIKHSHYAHSLVRTLSRFSSLLVMILFGCVILGLEFFNLSQNGLTHKEVLLMYLDIAFFVGIFAYYLYGAIIVRKDLWFHITIAASLALLTCGIIYKSYLDFGYYQSSDIYFDTLRTKDLIYIMQDINLYTTEQHTLPANLDKLAPYNQSFVYDIKDPQTQEPYTYTILSPSKYKLCAVFKTPLNFKQNIAGETFQHHLGESCYTRDLSQNIQAMIPLPQPINPPILTPVPTPADRKALNGIKINPKTTFISGLHNSYPQSIHIDNDEHMATPSELLQSLNNYRVQHKKNVLQWDDTLADLAQGRAVQFRNIRNTDNHAGFINYVKDNKERLVFESMGENSTWGYHLNATHMIGTLFASDEPHDKNQLDSEWTSVGIGVEDTGVDIIFAKN